MRGSHLRPAVRTAHSSDRDSRPGPPGPREDGGPAMPRLRPGLPCQPERPSLRLNIQSISQERTMAADQAAAIEFPAIPGSARASLDELIAEQEEIFIAPQPGARRLASRAAGALAGGVTSSWQSTRPQPVWLSHGQGSKIYDVDGNEYVDMAGGYGAALAGHAHPAIVDAIRGQVSLGTHFAQPTRSAI